MSKKRDDGASLAIKVVELDDDQGLACASRAGARSIRSASPCCGAGVRLLAAKGRFAARYERTCPECGFPWQLRRQRSLKGVERFRWAPDNSRMDNEAPPFDIDVQDLLQAIADEVRRERLKRKPAASRRR